MEAPKVKYRMTFYSSNGTQQWQCEVPAEYLEGIGNGKFGEILFPVDPGPIPSMVKIEAKPE